jgi:hypothetical protein
MTDFCELIELTESELDEVAGGNPFAIDIDARKAKVRVHVSNTLENNSSNTQTNSIDNSINVLGD